MSKGRILVVDDEPQTRAALALLLDDEGYEVTTAADGFKALDEIDAAPPDIVVTDLHMPGLTGMELIRALQNRAGDMAIVLVTAACDIQVGVAALREGAADYLAKPLDFRQLTTVLKREMEHLTLRRAHLVRKLFTEQPYPGKRH